MILKLRARGSELLRRVVTELGVKRAGQLTIVGAVVILAVMASMPVYAALKAETGIETAREANRSVERVEAAHEFVTVHAVAVGNFTERPGADTAKVAKDATEDLKAKSEEIVAAVGLANPAGARLARVTNEYFRASGLVLGVPPNLAATAASSGRLHAALVGVEDVWRGRGEAELAGLANALQAIIGAIPLAFGAGILLLGLMWVLGLEVRRSAAQMSAELLVRERQALTDSLTGAGNHRAYKEDLADALQGGPASGTTVGLAMLDVNDLKSVNNTQGHQAGDDRLRRAVDYLREAAPDASVYRIGGDEFALIQADTSAFALLALIQTLQNELPARSAPDIIELTAGIAEAQVGTAVALDEISGRADFALIAAKASNRGVMMFSSDLEVVPGAPPPATDGHAQRLATALARAVDAKDSYTQSHSQMVSELCAMIAGELGLPPERVADLRLAGLLHDVGKIGISDDILQKPAALTHDEYDLMKTHSAIGHRIVLGAGQEREAHWVLHHHERLDGEGYPEGLTGNTIPLESRVIHVADAFEAITSDRPYRKGRPAGEALAELDRHTGTQFDGDCVNALKRALADETPGSTSATPVPRLAAV